MTFDPNIPTDLPSPSISVDAIRTNFSQYGQVFDNNHVALNGTFQGKHTHVIFQQQLSDPDVEGSFDTLYGKSTSSNLGNFQSVFAKIPQFLPNQLPNLPMQLFFNQVNTAGPQYQSFLAGGYIIYFGKINSVVGTINSTITLVPAPSEILCVIPNSTRLVAPNGSLGPSAPLRLSVTLDSMDNSKFTIRSGPLAAPQITGDVNWLAIARQ